MTYNEMSKAPIVETSNSIDHPDLASVLAYNMFRRVLALLPLFLLVGVAFVAAVAAASPSAAEFVFLICLGLFVAAVADGVSGSGSERHE